MRHRCLQYLESTFLPATEYWKISLIIPNWSLDSDKSDSPFKMAWVAQEHAETL